MHPVRLVLVSAVLVAGCAVDDTLTGGVETTDHGVSATVTTATGRGSGVVDAEREANTVAAADAGTPGTGTTSPPTTVTKTAPDPITPEQEPANTATTVATELPAASTTDAGAITGTDTATTTTTITTTAPSTTTTTTTTTTTATTTTTTTTSPPEPTVDGFAVFQYATCATCHGSDGEGGTGADLSTSTLDREAVIEVIRFGVEDTVMDGWDFEPKPPGLTRAEIEAVAAYVMSLRGG